MKSPTPEPYLNSEDLFEFIQFMEGEDVKFLKNVITIYFFLIDIFNEAFEIRLCRVKLMKIGLLAVYFFHKQKNGKRKYFQSRIIHKDVLDYSLGRQISEGRQIF